MEKKRETRPDCRTCIYRAGKGDPHQCDYAMINRPHTRKAQPAWKCTYYVKGERLELSPQDRVALLDQPGVGGLEAVRAQKRRAPIDWAMGEKLQREGKTTEEIAKALGCKMSAVYKWRKRTGNKVQEKRGGRPSIYDWKKAEEMHSRGATNREIAEALGCQAGVVSGWERRTGRKANKGRKAAV